MMKTSYYVACHTKCKCTPEEYETESEKLKELFTLILTDPDKIHAMTHTEDLTSVHSELQVSHAIAWGWSVSASSTSKRRRGCR